MIEAIDKLHTAAMLIHEACPPRVWLHHNEYVGEMQTIRFYIKQIKDFFFAIEVDLAYFDIDLKENQKKESRDEEKSDVS